MWNVRITSTGNEMGEGCEEWLSGASVASSLRDSGHVQLHHDVIHQ